MKYFVPAITCFIAFFATNVARSGQQLAPCNPADPVCRFTFDSVDESSALIEKEGTTDDSLRAITGKARFVTAQDVPGVVGRAIAVGVENSDPPYYVAPQSDDLRLGAAYTIEGWIFPTTVGGWNRLALRWGGANEYMYHFAIHDGRLSLYHGQADGTYPFAEGGRIEPGRWYHVAGVARKTESGGELLVYLNGRQVGIAKFDGTASESANVDFTLGDSSTIPSPGSRYHGYVDELSFYRRALPIEEIAAIYDTRTEILEKLDQQLQKAEIARRANQFKIFQDLGVEQIVFASRNPGRDLSGHYYANFGHTAIDPNLWVHGDDGGTLYKLDLRSGRATALVDDPAGAVRDPKVHYDGKTILFSYRKGGTHHYNLYEIGIDGSGLKQLTAGPWDDVEATYLPDGGIAFCSTRAKRFIGCWLVPSAVLHRCDGDGRNIRMLSSGNFTENTPAVLPDGRILYTRWEYVNRDPVSFHHLWTMNPDGTSQMVYFGNMHPGGVFIDAQPLPTSEDSAPDALTEKQVGGAVMILSPGHGRNEHQGQVALITDRFGPDDRTAIHTITRDGSFRDPFPLSADRFLVARGNQVMLLGADGSTETLFTDERWVHEPRPIVSRPRERLHASRIDLSRQTGTLVLTDVYNGRNMVGVEPRSIKKLLILEDLPKPVNYHGGGSAPIGHGVTSTLKRILGTVPVEADGSAHFKVPAMRSVYFAALDENDRSIKQMRSFVTLQPGETATCLGCHEPRVQAPRPVDRASLMALSREPSTIEPIKGVLDVIDFPRDVQPILARHCSECHNPDRRDGGVTLTADRGPVFAIAYYDLLLHWQVKDTSGDPRHGTGRQNGNDPPYTTFSSASPLMKKIDGSHYDVKLSPTEQDIVRLWIDTSTQFAGTYAALGTGQIGGCWGNNHPIRQMADDWPETAPAAAAVTRRCGACHDARQLPVHMTARIPLDPWGDMLSWTRPLSRYSRHRIFNLSHPEGSLILQIGLDKTTGGEATGPLVTTNTKPQRVTENRNKPPQPIKHPIVFQSTDDPDYQAILTHIEAAKRHLEEIGRFDMPSFRPNEHYIREMTRYGILPADFDLNTDPIDVYEVDRKYWDAVQRP